MTDSDEPIQKIEPSDDESINLTSMSGDEIIKLAKYGNRDGRDRLNWFKLLIEFSKFIEIAILIGPILVDTLFLYVPIINENTKCLALDDKLKIIAIVLRSFTDLPFLLNHLRYVLPTCYVLPNWRTLYLLQRHLTRNIPQSRSRMLTILAVLPIPQVVILIFLPKTRNSRSLNRMKFLNSLILLQYVPRAYPMYKICKHSNKVTREHSEELAGRKQLWISGVLNIIMYILASHVFGALWYFFSVQREIDCWISTCRSENGCNLSTLQCDNTPFKNVTLLNDLCPTNPPNPMVYDFGIFVDSLQFGIVGTTDFPQKLLMCLSWGLRNLSSFGSNLNSSTNAWESVFVISISISGLLLFMYLLGHVQTFMQAISRTSQIWQRMRVIDPRINFMVSEYGLTRSVDYAIWRLVIEALEEDEGLAAENIFSLLPRELRRPLKCHLFLATLTKLEGLENKDRQVLDAIMEDLEPVSYADGTYIIREGEPLDRMLFITQGIALAYKTGTTGGESGSSSTTHIAKGEVYGKELMVWAAKSTPFSGLPISDQTVKSHEKVEVFAIRAARLKSIVSKFSTHFNTQDITTVEITSN
ncbi:cyclic nucleotide-gated ion channel 1-like [Pyrus ussuriensis x Pyrus communis]|uniref:Cyclic nucleotide-gated ion channel 1-like n=1 Tax=Pyrus ussuriensis x Pyrus communis TaxID=2448454 RepID=A0A5N5HG48_9ROSA|nr:cyclic nucleotide-gated ion channel 1-like [Pyrus ussuriensis x Pyrus communis]